jgi:hypothetical protein
MGRVRSRLAAPVGQIWKLTNALPQHVRGVIFGRETGVAIGSDLTSPWASVLRVEGGRSEVIAMHITVTWRDYCEAERMRNAFPLRGIVDDLQNLEQEYAGLNDGRELPLRPYP